MCGIAGVYNLRHDQPVSEELIRKMTGAIRHRGPDDDGFFVAGPVGHGMRRLSIIDVAGGHQPIANEDGSICVVYNGEMYNYRELRRDLEAQGHVFRTNSDTESIVHAYEQYGTDCLARFAGMFAFALWDAPHHTLFLARDRLGIKPLYYWLSSNELVFASEIKALLAHPAIQPRLNPAAVLQHFAYRYALAPLTVFDGVLKLLPGHLLSCSGQSVRVEQYWQVPDPPNGSACLDEHELLERLRETLSEAVRSHLMSEVPLGAFLSGGVDSSTIVGLMSRMLDRPVKTYSVGFGVGAPTDELHYARKVATHFNTDHHELECRSGSVELLRDIVWHLEEPILDPACIPTYLVARLAHDGVTVVLTGEGSDETNAGYRKYLDVAGDSALLAAYRRIPSSLRRAAGRVLDRQRRGLAERGRRFNARSLSWQDMLAEAGYRPYLGLALEQLFAPDLLAAVPAEPLDLVELFATELDHLSSNVDRMARLDVCSWLPDDLLLKVDKMTMAHSLEARVPYLDHRYVELAAGMPAALKVSGGVTKRLLRLAFPDLMPPEIAGRPQHGFDVPLTRWFRKDLREFVCDLLLDPSKETGLFNRGTVESIVRSFIAGDDSLALMLYGLVVFHVWHGQFIKDGATAK